MQILFTGELSYGPDFHLRRLLGRFSQGAETEYVTYFKYVVIYIYEVMFRVFAFTCIYFLPCLFENQ